MVIAAERSIVRSALTRSWRVATAVLRQAVQPLKHKLRRAHDAGNLPGRRHTHAQALQGGYGRVVRAYAGVLVARRDAELRLCHVMQVVA